MRILGIDYGERRIGLAISDPLLITAQGLSVVSDIEGIKGEAGKYPDISEIVVGLPKTLKGELGQSAQKVLEFVEVLKKHFTVPIITWDERMTSVLANRMFREAGISERKRRGIVDKTAAQIMLQSYLDSRKKT